MSAASFLFTYTDASTGARVRAMRFPDRVSVLCSGVWTILEGATDQWKSSDIQVTIRQDGNLLSLFVGAPHHELELIKCGWAQPTPASSKYLGDHWERSYGDLAWVYPAPVKKSPWYMLISDGTQTQAFGVKTGTSSICSWMINTDFLELTLDVHSGGMGVLLGDRILHAADIITTENLAGENPFHTDTRFCKMMCDSPRLPAKPVYGINDWYFAYGNNSRQLIYETTQMMADLVTDWSNAPFSVVDMG